MSQKSSISHTNYFYTYLELTLFLISYIKIYCSNDLDYFIKLQLGNTYTLHGRLCLPLYKCLIYICLYYSKKYHIKKYCKHFIHKICLYNVTTLFIYLNTILALFYTNVKSSQSQIYNDLICAFCTSEILIPQLHDLLAQLASYYLPTVIFCLVGFTGLIPHWIHEYEMSHRYECVKTVSVKLKFIFCQFLSVLQCFTKDYLNYNVCYTYLNSEEIMIHTCVIVLFYI